MIRSASIAAALVVLLTRVVLWLAGGDTRAFDAALWNAPDRRSTGVAFEMSSVRGEMVDDVRSHVVVLGTPAMDVRRLLGNPDDERVHTCSGPREEQRWMYAIESGGDDRRIDCLWLAVYFDSTGRVHATDIGWSW